MKSGKAGGWWWSIIILSDECRLPCFMTIQLFLTREPRCLSPLIFKQKYDKYNAVRKYLHEKQQISHILMASDRIWQDQEGGQARHTLSRILFFWIFLLLLVLVFLIILLFHYYIIFFSLYIFCFIDVLGKLWWSNTALNRYKQKRVAETNGRLVCPR